MIWQHTTGTVHCDRDMMFVNVL